jgi:Predicted hydrolase (HD superfamily)
MRWYAEQLRFGNEADYWAMVGLLHDINFEMWPGEHCVKAPELLKEINACEDGANNSIKEFESNHYINE